MRIEQLRYLSMVVQTGSFASAARRACITPQAVAKSIHQLEEELNRPLFRRSGRRIEPTEFCSVFAIQVNEVLQSLADLASFAAEYGTAPRFGGTRNMVLARMPKRCSVLEKEDFADLARRHPNLRLNLYHHANDACASAVKNRLADAAVVFGPIKRQGIECRRLATLRIGVAMAARHALASRASVSLRDLDGQAVARPLDMRYALALVATRLAALHAKPRFVEPGDDDDSLRAFLASGGMVLVSRGYDRAGAFAGCAVVPFRPEERMTLPVYLAFPSCHASALNGLFPYLTRLLKRKRTENMRLCR